MLVYVYIGQSARGKENNFTNEKIMRETPVSCMSTKNQKSLHSNAHNFYADKLHINKRHAPRIKAAVPVQTPLEEHQVSFNPYVSRGVRKTYMSH